MLLPKAFYFFFFAAMVALYPYLAVYYQSIGLSGAQMGVLMGLPPLVSLLSSPIWGALGDATRRHHQLLIFSILCAILAALVIPQITVFAWLLPVVAIYAFVSSPITALVDNSVIEALGERKDQYGKQRMWGAAGWGLAAPLMSKIIGVGGLRWSFYLYALVMAICLLVVLGMKINTSRADSGASSGIRDFISMRWVVFLGITLAGGMCMALVNGYLFLHLGELGASDTLMGFSLTVSTLSEFPFWFFSGYFLRRFKASKMLFFALLLQAVRTILYSYMGMPWQVLPLQLLQGPTFSLMWAAGVYYAKEIAPPGRSATAQGLFSGIIYGLGGAFGALMGGWFYDSLGTGGMFRGVGAISLIILLILGVLGRRRIFYSEKV